MSDQDRRQWIDPSRLFADDPPAATVVHRAPEGLSARDLWRAQRLAAGHTSFALGDFAAARADYQALVDGGDTAYRRRVTLCRALSDPDLTRDERIALVQDALAAGRSAGDRALVSTATVVLAGAGVPVADQATLRAAALAVRQARAMAAQRQRMQVPADLPRLPEVPAPVQPVAQRVPAHPGPASAAAPADPTGIRPATVGRPARAAAPAAPTGVRRATVSRPVRTAPAAKAEPTTVPVGLPAASVKPDTIPVAPIAALAAAATALVRGRPSAARRGLEAAGEPLASVLAFVTTASAVPDRTGDPASLRGVRVAQAAVRDGDPLVRLLGAYGLHHHFGGQVGERARAELFGGMARRLESSVSARGSAQRAVS